LRFFDADVRNNIDGVIMEIEDWIKKHTPPFGHPSQEGKREFDHLSQEGKREFDHLSQEGKEKSGHPFQERIGD